MRKVLSKVKSSVVYIIFLGVKIAVKWLSGKLCQFYRFFNVKSYTNLSLMMNEQKIAKKRIRILTYPNFVKHICFFAALFVFCG